MLLNNLDCHTAFPWHHFDMRL